MENASKALIMAAGVLIGIMVLSIAVYLFATFGTRSAELHRQIDDDRLNQFNTQFTSYELNNEITIYDVITVANLATENNTYYELPKVQAIINKDPSNYYVQVYLKNDKYNGTIEKGYTENDVNSNNDYNDIILNDTSKINNTRSLQKYNCTTHTSTITRKSI